MTYPRAVTSVHQLEVTSKCNLRCVYCPSKKMPELRGQPPMMMTLATVERALEWAVHYEQQGTQNELALTGIGEPLLHPEFAEIVRMAREALPKNAITFSTNGLLLTDKICEQIAPYRPEVYVSLHRPEKAGPAINAAKRAGILAGVNPAPATSAFDWAGQVEWEVSAPRYPCEYLRVGWCVVLVDGRITTCCLDASGAGVVGHVDDEIGSARLAPFSLCDSCHMDVPEPGELELAV